MTNEEVIEQLENLKKWCSSHREALTNAIEVLRADMWMPIATARNDEQIIVYTSYNEIVYDAMYNTKRNRWEEYSISDFESRMEYVKLSGTPLFWKPALKPPQEG